METFDVILVPSWDLAKLSAIAPTKLWRRFRTGDEQKIFQACNTLGIDCILKFADGTVQPYHCEQAVGVCGERIAVERVGNRGTDWDGPDETPGTYEQN